MTLAEAILQVEGLFQVHHDVGLEVSSYDQNDVEIITGARDMTLAPCGEPYVIITSGGIREAGEPQSMMFADEDRAVRFWTYAIEDLAEELRPREEWGKLHLYWSAKPSFSATDYVAVDQAALLREASLLDMHLTLGTVHSKLLLTKRGPDGKED